MRTLNDTTGGGPVIDSGPGSRPRLAVVGTGLGGLAAGWLLRHRYAVTLIEQHPRPGMGAFSVDYHSRGRSTRIDIPARVVASAYYPQLAALLQAIGVRLQGTDHAAAYADEHGEVFFHYGNLRLLGRSLAYPKGLASFGREGRALMRDSVVFFARVQGDMRTRREALAAQSLGDYLDAQVAAGHVGAPFVDRLLMPALSVICTCSYGAVRAYPADLLLGFLASGVMLQGVMRAEHGVEDIVARLVDGVDVQTHSTVRAIEAEAGGFRLQFADGRRTGFDQVIVATQAQQAASMVEAFGPLQALLEQVPFEPSGMIAHTDHELLPRSRLPLSPVTYHLRPDHDRPEVTVDLSKAFATFRGQEPVFQTWNPIREVRSTQVLAEARFTRPLVTHQSRAAMARLRALQAHDASGPWFCGSYVADRVPLLEAAACSAVDVARQLGATIPWDR